MGDGETFGKAHEEEVFGQRETNPGTLVSRARDGDSTERKTEEGVTRRQTRPQNNSNIRGDLGSEAGAAHSWGEKVAFCFVFLRK